MTNMNARRRKLTCLVLFLYKVEEPTEQTPHGPSHTPPAFVHGMTTLASFYGAQLHVRLLARWWRQAPVFLADVDFVA
jgi:hypothetical protein